MIVVLCSQIPFDDPIRYGGDDHHLYPNDPEKRAMVDQRMYFDMGVLYQRFSQVIVSFTKKLYIQKLLFLCHLTFQYPQFVDTFGPPLPPDKIQYFQGRMDKLNEALRWTDDFASACEKTSYIAGTEHLSLADLSLAATYSTMQAVGCLDLERYRALNGWMERMRAEIPKYEELCGDGARAMGQYFQAARQK